MKEILNYIFAFNAESPLLFTQFYFWGFFALVYALFALIMDRVPDSLGNKKLHLRNVYLMFVSWFFYYKTSGLFLLILLFVTLSDWLIAQRIYKTKNKFWLCLSVAIDLGFLAYFKYAYFFTDAFNDLFGTSYSIVDKIILPVGISFYIFQVISYTADVYRGRIQPVKNILDFGFYVSFFPQLVAGPIVRAEEFIPQLYKPFHLSRRAFGIAVFWIINGLGKKIIMSDFLAVNLIDRVFDNPLLFSGFENLFALFAYSLQVYADFSGYTDIAIGVAMLMGFYLPMNFNSPYKSQSPQEFWRRWHMSLGRWLKTYLYIPLGGNRSIGFGTYFWVTVIALVSASLTGWWLGIMIPYAVLIVAMIIVPRFLKDANRLKLFYSNLNSFITQVLGGLWHGASWNLGRHQRVRNDHREDLARNELAYPFCCNDPFDGWTLRSGFLYQPTRLALIRRLGWTRMVCDRYSVYLFFMRRRRNQVYQSAGYGVGNLADLHLYHLYASVL